MKSKPFDRTLYKKFDGPAKQAIAKWLEERHGHIATINITNGTGPDIMITFDDGAVVYAEVEVKRVGWADDGTFSYPTVQLPARKKKFLKHGYVEFYVLNPDMTRAIRILPHHLTDDRLKEVPNRYVPKGEYFYQVPMEHCEIIHLD